MEDVLADTSYGKIALAKLKPTDPNFMLYCAGYVEHQAPFKVMKVTGAIFRDAKSGPRKGKCCILVPGTQRTAYVYPEDYPKDKRKK